MTAPTTFHHGGAHPAFIEPPESARIWRYLSLSNLLWMLQKNALHFSRVDRFEDPFEGALPKVEVDEIKKIEASLGIAGALVRTHASRRAELAMHAACCWYLRPHESEAMWKLYAAQGIAIRSTFGRLVRSLGPKRDGGTPIYAGKVTYIDYETQATRPITTEFGPRWNNAYIPLMHKRQSFEHESELRAVLSAIEPNRMTTLDGGEQVATTAIPVGGCEVPVDLTELIEEVVVSPTMPLWFVDVVSEVVSRYRAGTAVTRSRLAIAPY